MSAQYTLHLASKNYSSWSMRPWLAMKMAGIPFAETVTRMYVPETGANIRKVSPSGKLPALEISENGGSLTVWDSLAICETLAERHPDKPLWPNDAAARASARSMAAEMHSGFSDIRKNLPMDLSLKIPAPELDDATSAQIARIAQLWGNALERSGGPFLFGGFSIADAFYAPVASRFESYSIALPEPASDYAERLLGLTALNEWRAAAKLEPRKPAA